MMYNPSIPHGQLQCTMGPQLPSFLSLNTPQSSAIHQIPPDLPMHFPHQDGMHPLACMSGGASASPGQNGVHNGDSKQSSTRPVPATLGCQSLSPQHDSKLGVYAANQHTSAYWRGQEAPRAQHKEWMDHASDMHKDAEHLADMIRVTHETLNKRRYLSCRNLWLSVENEAQRVKQKHGKESWRSCTVEFVQSHHVQMTLMFLLVIDVVVVAVELFLEAEFP